VSFGTKKGGFTYIRVSTDKQIFENQQHEIIEYCRKERLVCHKWICETISGTVATEDRELDDVLCNLRKGDVAFVVNNWVGNYEETVVPIWRLRKSVDWRIEPHFVVPEEDYADFLPEIQRTGVELV